MSNVLSGPSSRLGNLGFLTLLILAWMIPGVVGRDPWKSDESYTYGLVLHIIETGDHLAPTLAGEPFMQKPPLMFSTAAVCVKALAPWMRFEDSARMAVVLYLGVTLIALALAAREMLGPGKGWLGAAMFMGTIGQFEISHMLITDVSLLCGVAIGVYGMLLGLRKPKWGGLIGGTGIGMAFMSKGLLGPGVLGMSVVVLPLCFRAWRTRNHVIASAIAAFVSLPWVVIWPWLVYQRSPDLFHQWFWDNNLGRFFGAKTFGLDNKIGMIDERYYAFVDFPWYAFPITLVAVWALWKNGRKALSTPGVQIGLVATFFFLTVVTASRNGRTLYMLPSLAPAALVGAWALQCFSASFSRHVWRICLILFGLVFAAAWIGWLAQVAGQPAPLWAFIHDKLPDLKPRFELIPFVAAAIFTVLWLLWMLRLRIRDSEQSLAIWTVGISGAFLLLMTIWLPAMESRMSYAHLTSIKEVLPPDHGPIASLNIGEPQRAMFDFYAGIKTERLELGMKTVVKEVETENGLRHHHEVVYPDFHANWFLTERELFTNRDPQPPGGPWEEVWRSVHSGKELFRLYKRVGAKDPQTATGTSVTR